MKGHKTNRECDLATFGLKGKGSDLMPTQLKCKKLDPPHPYPPPLQITLEGRNGKAIHTAAGRMQYHPVSRLVCVYETLTFLWLLQPPSAKEIKQAPFQKARKLAGLYNIVTYKLAGTR